MTINNGVLEGKRHDSFRGTIVYEFLGIPYAVPPTGSLRFENPQPLETSWKGILPVKNYKDACVQNKDKPDSEDCLHLNIWVPSSNKSEDLKDVMVYFHGGAFNMGSASRPESNGSALATVGNVIVVTVNYRLGFLGFFMGEDAVNSNMGLRDQQLALKWVQDNIVYFKGNPKSVTVFGHSAGAISISLHIVNPVSSTLFHRAILQSGAPSFLRPQNILASQARSLSFSQFLNCSSDRETGITKEALKCLKSLSPDIIKTYGKEEKLHSTILPTPVFGDSFLSKPVSKILMEALKLDSGITPVDIMIGFESNEGNLFVRSQQPKIFKESKRKGDSKEEKDKDNTLSYDSSLKVLQHLLSSKNLPQEDISLVSSHYLHPRNTSHALKVLIARSYGDLYVYCPSLFLAESYSKFLEAVAGESKEGKEENEAMHQSHSVRRSNGKKNVWMYLKESRMSSKPYNKKCPGVCHGEEIPYVFGHPFLFSSSNDKGNKYSEADKHLSLEIMKMWTDFARDGG